MFEERACVYQRPSKLNNVNFLEIQNINDVLVLRDNKNIKKFHEESDFAL